MKNAPIGKPVIRRVKTRVSRWARRTAWVQTYPHPDVEYAAFCDPPEELRPVLWNRVYDQTARRVRLEVAPRFVNARAVPAMTQLIMDRLEERLDTRNY